MRIVLIIPGSGGAFYCQNCLRDADLARALRQQGHDAFVAPLYLPLAPGEAAPAFYRAVTLYLRHRYPRLMRWIPAALGQWLDSPAVLRFASHLAGSTRAKGLGDLTLSMLQGEQGQQAEELERLVAWLRDDFGARPDVVVLSNALLLGLARRIRAELGVPVVCWLQDEDVWADALPPDEARRVWQELRARVADVNGFVAVSRYYARRMAEALALPPNRIRVIHVGVDPEAMPAPDLTQRPRVVGFLSRLAEGEGFGLFVEAFLALHRDPRFADVRLKATGGGTDRQYVQRQLRRLRAAGLADLVEILPKAFRDDRAAFFHSLTLLSSPVPEGEAFGTYTIETMAAGVPVVEPPVGAYPEIFQEAGCGVLSAAATAEALAVAWGALLEDPARLANESARGREAVRRYFNLNRMARETVGLYEELTGRANTGNKVQG